MKQIIGQLEKMEITDSTVLTLKTKEPLEREQQEFICRKLAEHTKNKPLLLFMRKGDDLQQCPHEELRMLRDRINTILESKEVA